MEYPIQKGNISPARTLIFNIPGRQLKNTRSSIWYFKIFFLSLEFLLSFSAPFFAPDRITRYRIHQVPSYSSRPEFSQKKDVRAEIPGRRRVGGNIPNYARNKPAHAHPGFCAEVCGGRLYMYHPPTTLQPQAVIKLHAKYSEFPYPPPFFSAFILVIFSSLHPFISSSIFYQPFSHFT